MAIPVASDALLAARAATLRTLLNSGHTLRLLGVDITPAPDTPRGDYAEPAFGGYAAISLAGEFGPPVQVRPGQWRIDAGPFTWTPTGLPNALVYGWYIDSGTDVPFASLFQEPVLARVGFAIQFAVRPTELSRSLFP